jgi:hypothetical protein
MKTAEQLHELICVLQQESEDNYTQGIKRGEFLANEKIDILRSALTGALAALDAAATGATLSPPSEYAKNIRAMARSALQFTAKSGES